MACWAECVHVNLDDHHPFPRPWESVKVKQGVVFFSRIEGIAWTVALFIVAFIIYLGWNLTIEREASSTSHVLTNCFRFVLASASGIGFFTSYPKGETYTKPDNTTCVLNTVMKFACNATAYWDSESSATVISVPVKPIIQLTLGAKLCTVSMTALMDHFQSDPLWWYTALSMESQVRDHLGERPPWWETTGVSSWWETIWWETTQSTTLVRDHSGISLVRDHCGTTLVRDHWGTTLVRDHCGTTLVRDHWGTTLERDYPGERPLWYHRGERPLWYHPGERPPWWETTVVPPWWETTGGETIAPLIPLLHKILPFMFSYKMNPFPTPPLFLLKATFVWFFKCS